MIMKVETTWNSSKLVNQLSEFSYTTGKLAAICTFTTYLQETRKPLSQSHRQSGIHNINIFGKSIHNSSYWSRIEK